MRQQNFFLRKLESPAGKCKHTKTKVGVKIRLIGSFREVCLSLLSNEFNKFNNTRAQMLDSIYHMTL